MTLVFIVTDVEGVGKGEVQGEMGGAQKVFGSFGAGDKGGVKGEISSSESAKELVKGMSSFAACENGGVEGMIISSAGSELG